MKQLQTEAEERAAQAYELDYLIAKAREMTGRMPRAVAELERDDFTRERTAAQLAAISAAVRYEFRSINLGTPA